MIQYCNRPFDNIEDHDETIIDNHNSVVGVGDYFIHAGDFTLKSKHKAKEYLKRLNGKHIFLKGSHDYWMPRDSKMVWEKKIKGHFIVACHYCFRTWGKSHYDSWHLFGHSHGSLPSIGKSHDVGLDNNGYFPVSFDQIVKIMAKKPNNPNSLRR